MIEIDEGRMKDIFTADQEGKSAKEIAKALKLPLGTVKRILGEEEELKEFSDAQLDVLARQYQSLAGKTISIDQANKLRKIFKGVPDRSLDALRRKKIPFLSGLALSRMVQKGMPVKEDKEEPNKELEPGKGAKIGPAGKIALAKEKDTDALEAQLTTAKGQIELLKTKLENEKNKAVKPEPNKETGEVPLTVGVAHKYLKDKAEKEKEEKKDVKEAFAVQITKKDGGKLIHGKYKDKAAADKFVKWYKTGDMKDTKSIEVVKEMAKDDAYAIGMAQAKKSMNDEPPLEKKTITKGHEIAKKILAKEDLKEAKYTINYEVESDSGADNRYTGNQEITVNAFSPKDAVKKYGQQVNKTVKQAQARGSKSILSVYMNYIEKDGNEISDREVDKLNDYASDFIYKGVYDSYMKEARWQIEGQLSYRGIGSSDGFHMVIDAPNEKAAEEKAYKELDKARDRKKIGPGGGGSVEDADIESIERTSDRLQAPTTYRVSEFDPSEVKEGKAPFRLSYDDRYGKHAGFEDAKTLADLQNKAANLRKKGFVINKMGRNTSPVKEETIMEFTSQQIKQAYGIANDPRYKAGNYDGAVKAIEKLAKGLSKHPDVAKVLKRTNENAHAGARLVFETIKGIKNKAEKSGMPYSILKKVYDRGMAAWRGGHRPGTTQQQWAFARVNSFVTKSSGTWGGADKDLAKQVRGKN